MLGVSGLVERSEDGVPPPPPPPDGGETGGGGGGGVTTAGSITSTSNTTRSNDNLVGIFGDEENAKNIDEGERNSAGNRWPRQETLALLKIRSDMDVTFRDSSVKGPLWDEVSRKMAELGYQRSAKKCKEKFENVYKYHKRTKEGRTTKSDGKTYRFFDQLEALDQNYPSFATPPLPPPQKLHLLTMAMPVSSNPPMILSHHLGTVTSTMNPTHAADTISPSIFTITPLPPPLPATTTINNPTSVPPQLATNPSHSRPSSIPNFRPTMSSSSTSSDEEFQKRNSNRKRKWKDFFERLMKDVIDKQEQLQKKFLETIEKREHDRMVREEAWRMQEMARLNREHEILVQERSMAAAKDTAVITFLQKISDQHQIPVQLVQSHEIPQTQQPHRTQVQSQPQPQTQVHAQPQMQAQTKAPPSQPPPPPVPPAAQMSPILSKTFDTPKPDNGNLPSTSSRWPKSEVQALINLRTTLDIKYQESGPKGPLWEEISSGMRKLGYNRNAKRCKEKWENINKYFKKVKESNKQRPEDSKTCPYFHLLDALYKEKNKCGGGGGRGDENYNPPSNNIFPNSTMTPPLMVQPEQQWPPQQPQPTQAVQHQPGNAVIYNDKEEEDDEEDLEDDEDDDDGDDEEDNGGEYEIVANKQQASAAG